MSNDINETVDQSVEAARVRVLRNHVRIEPGLGQTEAFCGLCEETWPCGVAIIAGEPNRFSEVKRWREWNASLMEAGADEVDLRMNAEDERNALAATVARVEELADKWEREADRNRAEAKGYRVNAELGGDASGGPFAASRSAEASHYSRAAYDLRAALDTEGETDNE